MRKRTGKVLHKHNTKLVPGKCNCGCDWRYAISRKCVDCQRRTNARVSARKAAGIKYSHRY